MLVVTSPSHFGIGERSSAIVFVRVEPLDAIGKALGDLVQLEIPDFRVGPPHLLCRLWCAVVRFGGWGVGGIAAPLPLCLLLLLLLLLFFGFGALFGPRAGLGLSTGFLGGAKNTVKKKKSVSRASAKKSHFSGSYSLTLGGIWCTELLLWRVRGGGSRGGVLPVELPLGLGGGWWGENAQGEECQFHENEDFKRAITQREK